MPSEFEKLLTRQASLQYNIKTFDVAWLHIEAVGDEKKLSAQLGRDMLHFEALRKAVAEALSPDPDQRSAIAQKWRVFLKPRVEVLEYWSSLVVAIGALMVAGGTFIAATNNWPLFAVAGTFHGAVAAAIKFEVDRKKLWYKYLISHLEAI